jgi:aminoglycoside phosphotransferase (APT) family kinase protein
MSAAGAQTPDAARLDAWLAAHLPGYAGPLRIERFEGGQSNPTFKLIAPSGPYVLRRKPMGEVLPSAHAVDREFRVLRALQGTDVPVPRVLALCEDPAVIGSIFYVMAHLDGRVFWDPRLPELAPAERGEVFDAMGAAIAALHRLDHAALGLADYGRPGNYLERQVARWTKQYRASETRTIPGMDRLIEWLPRHIPASGTARTGIVHGDYRIDNLIFHPTEPRVLGVLDWELSTLGDPLADFASHVMAWRVTPAQFRGLAGLDLAALGIPTEAEYLAAYCRRTGQSRPPDWETYVVFGMFRMVAILQGVYRRGLAGSAASDHALEHGGNAVMLAEVAWELASRLA